MLNIFENRAVDENQLENINRVKEQADYLYKNIIEFCPSSREQSIAITKLEETVMWATKSVAHDRK